MVSGLRIQVVKYCSMLVMNIPFPDDLGFDPARKLSTPPLAGSVLRLLLPLGREGPGPLGMTITGGPPRPPGGPAPGLGGGGAPGGQPGGGGGCMPARGSPPL
jgi:hypothetical protein